MCRTGDVALLRFPFSDMAVSKRRPVVVLTDPDTVGDFTCVAITSSTKDIGHRVELSQSDFLYGELPRKSWVRSSKVYTVNLHVAVGKFGILTEAALRRVREAVCGGLGCRTGELGSAEDRGACG